MGAPWQAEHALDAVQARTLIDTQFPALAPARVEPLGVGWDNTALLVNGVFVFRFPRRRIAADLIEHELHVLPAVARRLPRPISAPCFAGRPADGYAWPFAGAPYLPGRTGCRAALDDDARRALAAPLGQFLAALHAVDGPEATALGAPPDHFRKADLRHRVPQARQRLEALVQRGLIEDTEPWQAVIDAADGAAAPARRTLVHGDLYARHLLVGDDGALAGVIDWGDLHAGAPWLDLSIAHGLLPRDAHEAFRAAYGPIESIEWILARFRAVTHGASIAAYAHDVGDTALRAEMLMSLALAAG